MKTIAVIGSGIGGLAAAIRMAVKGYDVHVFEKNQQPGGKLYAFKTDEFRFDAGPSLFTLPHLVDELFELAGKNPKDYFQYEKLEVICKYFYDDGTTIKAYADPDLFAKECHRVTGTSETKVKKHLQKSAFIFKATNSLFLEKSLHKTSSYLRFSTFFSFLKLPFLNIFSSMHYANSKLGNEKLTQLFDRYATYNGSNPYRASAVLNLIPHLEFGMGAYFPKGGMIAITEALYQLALELGVTFHWNEEVQNIEERNGNIVSIQTAQQQFFCDLLISNMDIFPFYKNVLKDHKQIQKLKRQERSSSALIFYWGIDRNFSELLLHNILFSADYKAEFESIFTKKEIFEDPTVYINITSKLESTDAPKNCENWFVMINVPSNSTQNWDHQIEKAKDAVLKKISKCLNCDVSKYIVTEKILDPLNIELQTNSYQGSLYGSSSNSRTSAFFRHPNFSKKNKNLYFCGGSVHPGGGIPLALSSAKIVDQLIQKP